MSSMANLEKVKIEENNLQKTKYLKFLNEPTLSQFQFQLALLSSMATQVYTEDDIQSAIIPIFDQNKKQDFPHSAESEPFRFMTNYYFTHRPAPSTKLTSKAVCKEKADFFGENRLPCSSWDPKLADKVGYLSLAFFAPST